MTLSEFEQQTFTFQNKPEQDLETYLLALLNLVEQHRNKAPTPELLLELLQSAFTASPAAWDNTWLHIKSSPETTEEKKQSDVYRDQAVENPFPETPDTEDLQNSPDLFAGRSFDGIDYTIAVLQFQISELHKMKGKQLVDEWRSMGIDSETGNRWYNFDPKSNIACGIQCFLDHGSDEDDVFETDWETLGLLLEMGRMYE